MSYHNDKTCMAKQNKEENKYECLRTYYHLPSQYPHNSRLLWQEQKSFDCILEMEHVETKKHEENRYPIKLF